jgi:hypothetical protein
MAASVGGVTVNFTAQTAQFVEGVKRVEGALAGFGKHMTAFQARMRAFNKAARLLTLGGPLVGIAIAGRVLGDMVRGFNEANLALIKGEKFTDQWGGGFFYWTNAIGRSVPVIGSLFGELGDALGEAFYGGQKAAQEFDKAQKEAARFAKANIMARKIGRETQLMKLETDIAFGDEGQAKARQAAIETMRQIDAIADKQRKLGEEASAGGPGGNSVAINKAMADLELQKKLLTAQGALKVSELMTAGGTVDQVISGRFTIGGGGRDKQVPIIGDPEQTTYLRQIAEGISRPAPALAR